MNEARSVTLCEICSAEVSGESTVCQGCQRAFESGPVSQTADGMGPLDLGKYSARMFPWEQITTAPRLISVSTVWLVLALGLIVLVLLLALLRTPLPSCWELSS
jgi:hypothetical protein